MKKSGFVAFMLLVLITNMADAGIWRVNNNAGISTDYINFITASNAAADNDTLYMESSVTSYGNITLTKPLVIIGPGYFLTENPQTQANLNSAKLGTVIFNSTSAGSVILGMEITGQVTIISSNISIRHCRVASSIRINSTSSISNILLSQCFITGNINNLTGSAQVTNVLISNCYLGSGEIYFPVSYSGVISNNILRSTTGFYPDGILNVFNFNIINNIIYNGDVILNNSTVYNNLCNATQIPLINNNQQNIDMTQVFVGSTGNSTDGQYQLAGGSPAIVAGLEGVDCGFFGGNTPYVLSGLPPVPAIYEVILPATGTNLNGININLKSKVH